jgi:tetratricopeptide (TPR) repeat protein/TolB-like protein
MVMKKAVIILLISILFFRLADSAGNNTKVNILVYPFESAGGNKYSWIAAGLTDTVISDLNGIRDVYVFSDSDRRKALKEISLGMTGLIKESDVVKIGKVMGANMIFTGSVQTSGTRVRVNAKLVNIETTRVEKSVKIDGSVDAVFDLQDKVVLSLMSKTEANETGSALNESNIRKSPDKKKPSDEVYELYAKGLELNETDPGKALEFFLKALAADPEYLDALIKTGSLYDDLGRYDEALASLLKAQDILDKRGASGTAEYAETLNNTGVVYRDLGDHEKALEYYAKAQKIRESLKLADTVNYAETSSNIGIVYVDTGKYDKALEYYLSAQKIMDSINFRNSSKYAILINNIGGVYWSKNDYNTALKYYLISQEIRDTLGLQNTAGYAYLMNNIGGVHWKKNDNNKAILYYVKSQEIRDWLGLQNTESYTTLMNNIALTYYKRLKDPCKGAEYMKKCVELGRKNNFLRLQSDMKEYKEMEDACRNK